MRIAFKGHPHPTDGFQFQRAQSAAAGGTRIVEQQVRLLLELPAWDAIAFAATKQPVCSWRYEAVTG
jgi:hypothetical protein